MNYIYEILCFIKKKRKQITFALFALILYLIDNNISNELLKAGAPIAVAAAAGAAGGATGGTAAAAGAAATSSATAATAASGGSMAGAATNMTGANAAKMAVKSNESATVSVPKNTNPNAYNSNVNSSSLSNPTESLQKNTTVLPKDADDLLDEETNNKTKNKKDFLQPSTENDVEDEEEIMLDNASKDITRNVGKSPIGCIFTSLFLMIFSVPILILLVVNATTSTMSSVDCSMQDSVNCVQEEATILNKLKNLFAYGAYGSNTEVVIKEIEHSYESIKSEYDFIINTSLLTSSLFSDSEYINTGVNGSQITITDKMLDRVQYIYEMAKMQMNPRFHIFVCNVSSYYDYETGGYVTNYFPAYQYTTEDEDLVEAIPEGECNASTAGSQYKTITYYYDEEKYFQRLKDSEELDFVYADFFESDELLISKIQNQYYLYKKINQITDVSEYADVPIQLEYDDSVKLSSPLKGWYSITSPFGMRDGEYAGMHTGIDLVSSDKNIYSAGEGVVTRSNVETEGGNVIEITHTDSSGRKYVSQYAHLSQRLVNVGDVINSGQVIGIMGDTGTMASGVHLHFSMWNEEPYELLNPRKLFNEASNY